MSVKKCSIMLLLYCVAALSFSQTAAGKQNGTEIPKESQKEELALSVEDAVYMAIRNNLNLKSQSLEQNSKEWKLYTFWNTFLPNMSLSGTLSKSNLSEEDRTIMGKVTPEWSAALGFNLSWTLNASMVFGAYQTCLDYQAGKITYEDATRKLTKTVKQTYYSLLLQQADLDMKKKELRSKEERYKQAAVGFKNGLRPKLELLRAQVAYETVKPEVLDKENILKNNFDMLKYLLGTNLDTNIRLTDTFITEDKVTPDLNKTFALFEKNNLTLKNLYVSKNIVKNSFNVYLSSLTPSFQLGFSSMPAFGKDPMKDAWFDDPKTDWKDRSGSFNLSVSLPISEWIPFSKNQVNMVGANIAVSKMDTDIKDYVLSSKLQIQKAIDTLATSIQTIDTVKLNVAVAEEAYKLAQDEFRLGTKELLDVQDVEDQLLKVQQQELSAEFNYVNNMLELEYLLNTDLKEIIRINKGE